ncbi:MAG TPA: glutathione transferase GstA [Allosphingosinicella sp.]|jgi:glutathione S-transferase
MKLYYTPGACSQAPHIALSEAGAAFEAVKVDLAAKKLADGTDYRSVNHKGAVPALELDDGSVLTENAAILQYIGEQKSDMLPATGMKRYRLLEWLTYISTELHKGFGPLWNPSTPEEYKKATRETLANKFDYLQERLGDAPYLTGDTFSLADAYAFVILNWSGMHDIDLSRWPGLTAYVARIAARPAVRQVLEAEGLLKQPA